MASFANEHCGITSGTNECGICFEKAWFSNSIPQQHHPKHPPMELFVCGHGVCRTCYGRMTENKSFRCPLCRATGILVTNLAYAVSLSLESRGYPIPRNTLPSKKINTFSEFLEEHDNNWELLQHRNSPFMNLHRQIIFNHCELKRAETKRKMKELEMAKRTSEKKAKAASRQNAFCPHCNKSTFTGEKQLQIHIAAKHANKNKKSNKK
jgi:hypothetical protein